MAEKLTYSSAVTELESIIENIEKEKIDIADLTQQLKRAAKLVQFCKEQLRSTEKEINKIMENFEAE